MTPIATLGAGCFVIKDGKILLVQPNYGPAKGSWILPGGFVTPGEKPEAAAVRELFEETGQVGRVVAPICVRHRSVPPDVYWVFRVEIENSVDLVVQQEELLGVRFWNLAEAIGSPEVRQMTRLFLSAATQGIRVEIPEPYAKTDSVYFF